MGLAAVAAVAALGALVSRAWPIDFDYSIDFQTYWLAGSRVLHGEAAKLYDAGGGPAQGVPALMAASEFKNIPIVAVAFVPLATLDYAVAKRVFWWLSLVALVGTSWIVGRFLVPEAIGPPLARCLGAFALIAVMAPTQIALRHGQTTPLLALLVAAWATLLRRGLPSWAGGALAGACVVKFPPLALAGLDAVRGRWRSVGTCLAVLAGVLLLSFAAFGTSLHWTYARGVLEQAGQVMTGHNNQSLAAVVTRLAAPAPLNDWTPRAVAPGAAWIGRLVLLGLAVWAGLRGMKERDPSLARLPYEGLAALAIGIVILPVAWDHYFLLLAPGLIAVAGALALRRGRPGLLAALLVAYVLLSVPTPTAWLDRQITVSFFDGLIVSHYFVGAVIAAVVAVLSSPTVAARVWDDSGGPDTTGAAPRKHLSIVSSKSDGRPRRTHRHSLQLTRAQMLRVGAFFVPPHSRGHRGGTP
jgi:alpha-1,2-mannosyltransferase